MLFRDSEEKGSDVKRLWKNHLRQSQLPDTLTDEVGVIAKPTGW